MLCIGKKNNYGIRGTGYGLRNTDYVPRSPFPVPRKQAFTLIELIIVAGALAVISLAIYAVFNSGMKIWENINIQVAEEDLNIFFDKFTTDLSNSFKFTGIDFLGKEDKLEFPTLVYSPNLNKKTVGQIIYSYNSAKEMLEREQRDFSQHYDDEKGTIALLLRNIKMVKFRYYVYDEETKEYFWQDEWFGEGLPVAVKLELILDDGTQSKRFAKTVTIPLSS